MPIPEKAKKVFEGIIYNVYHWEQELFDGTYRTFEMLDRPDRASVIPVKGDKIMLIREEQPGLPPVYAIPGGRVDPGESVEETAKRELLEEVGVTSDNWELYTEYRPSGKIDFGVHIYIVRDAKEVTTPEDDPGERCEVLWANFDEFVEIVSRADFPGIELSADILRMRLEPERLEEFKSFLFK